jgi:hypothetical protein
MAIITISRGAYSRGTEVARQIAQRLGYRSFSNEIILETSQIFQVPEYKLDRAIHVAPTLLERLFSEKQKHLLYITAKVIEQFKNDNVIYHGSAGHFFARPISPVTAKFLAYFKMDHVIYDGFAEEYYTRKVGHLLNVRIEANFEDRVCLLIKEKNLSRKHAEKLLKKIDKDRSSWSRHFYGIDNTDHSLYGLVIHLDKMTVEDAVDLICETVSKPEFKTTAESQQIIEDLALAAGIKAALFNIYPGCEVIAEKKSVEVYVRFTLHTDTMISEKIRNKVLKIPGVNSVCVILIPSVLFT